MGPNTNLNPELRECFRCKYEAVIASKVCPRCGKRLHSARDIRVRGWLLIGVGLFLVCFMGAIAVFVATMLAGIKDPAAARRLHDDAGTLLAIYALFGMVIAFGLHSIVIGIWQVIFGKRNRILIWVMWALLFLLFVFGGFVRALVEK